MAARSLLPLLVAVAPIVPASRAHRAGHVAEGEDDAGVGAPWPPQDGRGNPDAGQLATDEAIPRLLRLRRPLLRRERAADARGGVQMAFLHGNSCYLIAILF